MSSPSSSRVRFKEVLPSTTVERRRSSGTVVYPTVAQRKGSLDRASKDLQWLGGTICSSPLLQEDTAPETNTIVSSSVVTEAPHETNSDIHALAPSSSRSHSSTSSRASSYVSDSVGSNKN